MKPEAAFNLFLATLPGDDLKEGARLLAQLAFNAGIEYQQAVHREGERGERGRKQEEKGE